MRREMSQSTRQLARVILFRTLPLANEDAQLVASVESFVNQLERWQKHLLDYVSRTAAPGGVQPAMQRV